MPDVIQNVVIQFEKRVTGDEDIIDSLTEQQQLEQSVANTVKKANAAWAEQSKSVDQSSNSIQKFNQSLKNVPKVIVGQGIKEVEELKKKIDAGGLSVNAFATALALTKKRLQELPQGSKAYTQLQNEIKASLIANDQLNKSFTSTRSELRAMREALTQLEDAGLENTRIFNEIAISAGRLDDSLGDTQTRIKALGSDTLALDAGIQVVQGVAGAYSALQGITALVGTENEELQQTLLRVNAAMSILNGLQQVQQVLQKQSAISTATSLALRRLEVVQINLTAAAESRNIVVRYAAAAAQRVLNAVMAANPVGIVLVAIAGLATALLALTTNTNKAAAAQKLMNDELETFIAVSKLSATVAKQQSDVMLATLEAQGIKGAALRKAETQALRDQVLIAKQQYDRATADLAKFGTDRSKLSTEEQKEYLRTLQIRQETGQTYFDLENQLAVRRLENVQKDNEERIEAIKKGNEREKEEREKFLRDQVAAAEAAILQARSARERLDAEINAASARAREGIGRPDATSNERLLAEIKAGEDIRKARETFFGDLQKLERDHNTLLTQVDNERVLESAQANQQILQQKQQNAQEQVKITEERIAREKELEKQMIAFIAQSANSLASSLVEVTRNQNEEELRILQHRLDQGLISQQEYDFRLRQTKKRQAQQEKALALFQAIINTASAVVEALPNLPLSILAGVLGAAQIAAIASRPIPAFKKGTKNAPGGLSVLAEAGGELVYQKGKFQYVSSPTVMSLEPGASVIPALDTAKILSSWNIPLPGLPKRSEVMSGQTFSIDYKKLGAAIGKEVSKLPISSYNMDENGFWQYQTTVAARQHYQRSKYKIPGR